jgi:hypothetical protein
LSPATKASIDRALDEADAVTGFTSLKADPGRVGLDSVLRASAKLAFLRDLRLPGALLSSVRPKMLERFRRRLTNESAWEVRQHPTERRHALCAVFLHVQQRATTDGLVELLISIVHKIAVNAERKVVRELLHDFSRVHGKDRLLGRIAEASLGNPDGTIREVLYPLVGEDVLINLLREYKASGPAYTRKVHTVVRTSYGGHLPAHAARDPECIDFSLQQRPLPTDPRGERGRELEQREWLHLLRPRRRGGDQPGRGAGAVDAEPALAAGVLGLH